MKEVFAIPDLDLESDSYPHPGGVNLGEVPGLIDLQGRFLVSDIQFNAVRRNLLTRLEDGHDGGIQRAMHSVLKAASDAVVKKTQSCLGRSVKIDPHLSAIWVETSSATPNLTVHRDAESYDLVRATFSIAPTRLLSPQTDISVDSKVWRNCHVPLGVTCLQGLMDQVQVGPSGSLVLMSGATYHRAPNQEEIRSHFKELYSPELVKMNIQLPRIFGSIWGQLNW